jgi:hypothetical protein
LPHAKNDWRVVILVASTILYLKNNDKI